MIKFFRAVSWLLLVSAFLLPLLGIFTVVFSIGTKDSAGRILLCVFGMVLTFVAGGLIFYARILLRFLTGDVGNNEQGLR